MARKKTTEPDDRPTRSATGPPTPETMPEAAATQVRAIWKGLRVPSAEERRTHVFIFPPGPQTAPSGAPTPIAKPDDDPTDGSAA